jgi:hypothetical protein
MIRDAGIDVACIGAPYGTGLRFRTAFSWAPNKNDFVEVGWETFWGVGSVQTWRLFFEYTIGEISVKTATLVACCRESAFKTIGASGSSWRGKVDYDMDGTDDWVQSASVPNMTAAYAQAETGRRGNSHYYDHPIHLKYLDAGADAGGVWRWWRDVALDRDSEEVAHCHRLSNTAYETHAPNTNHVPGSSNYFVPTLN